MSISFRMELTYLVDEVRVDEMLAEINERDPLEKYGRTALLTDTAALTTDNRQQTTDDHPE